MMGKNLKKNAIKDWTNYIIGYECKAKNIKGKSKELKLKAVVEAEELKKKVVKNAKKNKKKYNKSILKQKLIKFKNSKTLTKFMEK